MPALADLVWAAPTEDAHNHDYGITPIEYHDDTAHVVVQVPGIGDSGSGMVELIHTVPLYILPAISILLIVATLWQARHAVFDNTSSMTWRERWSWKRIAHNRQEKSHRSFSENYASDTKVLAVVAIIPMVIWLIVGLSGALTSDSFSQKEMDSIAAALRKKMDNEGVKLFQGTVPSSEVVAVYDSGTYAEEPFVCQVRKTDPARFNYDTGAVDASCLLHRTDITPNAPWITFPNVTRGSTSPSTTPSG